MESKKKLSYYTSIKISRSQKADTLGTALKTSWWETIDWAVPVSGKGSGFQGYWDSVSSRNTKLQWVKSEIFHCNSHPTKLASGMISGIWTLSSVNCPQHSAIKWLKHIALLWSLQWSLWARINLSNGISVQNSLADENYFWIIPVQRDIYC